MTKVILLADPETPANAPHVWALRAAILAAAPAATVHVTRSSPNLARQPDTRYCPLTLDLPPALATPASRACQDRAGLRRWIGDRLHYATGAGELHLPIVLTARGPLYAEAIAPGPAPDGYRQPYHLTDDLRQPLYHLAYELLDHLGATPAVYTLQFSQRGAEIVFDCLWPFPMASAIASQGVQEPDLFTCHWRCLTEAPILDLCIAGRHAAAP